MIEDNNTFDEIKQGLASSEDIQSGIQNESSTWPQTRYDPITGENGLNLYPKHKTRGFLPPVNLEPILSEESKFGQYTYRDWRGNILSLNTSVIDTKDKFEESKNIPKNESELVDYPYSTRDSYLIYNDNSTDYFKHGIHIIDRLTPIENPINGSSNLRLDNFTSTPFENNDPIVYGFDIIIDDISSPLLNGSILDFIRNYSGVSEIAARASVYEDFKQQFIKFFKTKATVRINEPEISITKMREASYPEVDNNKDIFQNGKKSYLNYYLKKIDGLDNLIESNTSNKKKFLTSYNEDIISLSFSEDVTMSVGTLAHLYKLLYWSKPNGKGIIPENLLRFNCDIVISEVRNFNRVRKASETNNLEIIKDNVSRYVYSLKECQFYFNQMPHDSSIDMGASSTVSAYGEGSYVLQFDYKYVSSKLERFMPTQNGFGQYVGYDAGAIWRKSGNDGSYTSVPSFLTVGENRFNNNGVNSPFVISKPEDRQFKRMISNQEPFESTNLTELERTSKINNSQIKKESEYEAIASSNPNLKNSINIRKSILDRTLNKVLFKDVLMNSGQRIFFDVRRQLSNFIGYSINNTLNKTIR